jgi:hypothetical protein
VPSKEDGGYPSWGDKRDLFLPKIGPHGRSKVQCFLPFIVREKKDYPRRLDDVLPRCNGMEALSDLQYLASIHQNHLLPRIWLTSPISSARIAHCTALRAISRTSHSARLIARGFDDVHLRILRGARITPKAYFSTSTANRLSTAASSFRKPVSCWCSLWLMRVPRGRWRHRCRPSNKRRSPKTGGSAEAYLVRRRGGG